MEGNRMLRNVFISNSWEIFIPSSISCDPSERNAIGLTPTWSGCIANKILMPKEKIFAPNSEGLLINYSSPIGRYGRGGGDYPRWIRPVECMQFATWLNPSLSESAPPSLLPPFGINQSVELIRRETNFLRQINRNCCIRLGSEFSAPRGKIVLFFPMREGPRKVITALTCSHLKFSFVLNPV